MSSEPCDMNCEWGNVKCELRTMSCLQVSMCMCVYMRTVSMLSLRNVQLDVLE